jgi:hypothetical protein
MSSKIKKGVACAIQALDGTRARRSLISKLTDAHARAKHITLNRKAGYLATCRLAVTGKVGVCRIVGQIRRACDGRRKDRAIRDTNTFGP